MNIQETINQRQFKNSYHKLTLTLILCNNWLQDYLKNYLAKEDLTLQQYNILRILRGSGPEGLSTLEIRERMLDRMSDTSRIVDRLLLKKLVTKKISKTDKRMVEVRITKKGLNTLLKLDDIENSLAQLWGGITEKEAEQISQLLDKAYTN